MNDGMRNMCELLINVVMLSRPKMLTGLDQNGFESLEDVTSILLFTDGLQLPSTTPVRKKSFDRLADKFQEEGLIGVKKSIRKIESQDPDIRRYPRFKCHDDIAAIAVHL